MIHKHPVYDTDPHFSIDPSTRGITYTSSEKLILIQGDHNSQIYTFEIPRYIDGHDMMSCNLVQVHYINIDGSNSKNRSNGVYEVLDMQLSPEDENTCVFSWLISANATLFVGRLGFAIRFSCMEEDEPTYVWNTSVYDGVGVSTGYNNSNVVVSQYLDVLESWYWEFKDVTSTGVNVIEIARDEALVRINSTGGLVASETEPEAEDVNVWFNTTDSTLRVRNAETGEFEAIETIKGEKGDMPPIVQTTGDSETDVMSQKAVTTEINILNEVLISHEDQLSSHDSSISDHETRISDHETRISDHETRITSLTSIIEGTSNRVSDLENTLYDYNDIKSTVINHETSITNIGSTLNSMEESITEIGNIVAGHTAEIEDHETRISDHETRIEANKTSITDHETRIDEVETKVENLESNSSPAQVLMYSGNGGTEITLTLPFKPALMIIQDTERTMSDLYVPYGFSSFTATDYQGDIKHTVYVSYTDGTSDGVTVTISDPDPDNPTDASYIYNTLGRTYAIVAIGPFVKNSGYLT